MTTPFRRIVTGHSASGDAIIVSDASPDRVIQIGGAAGATFFEVWNTRETPARIDRQSGEPAEAGLVLAPPPAGTRIRVIDFPPEGAEIRQLSREAAEAQFDSMSGASASTSGRHPLMHRTQTVDYGIVLEGAITLVLDQQETTIHAGDIVVQRGTNHAWANRSGHVCRMAFVLIDGEYVDGL